MQDELRIRFVSTDDTLAEMSRQKVEHIFKNLIDVFQELKTLCVSQDANFVGLYYQIGKIIEREYEKIRVANDRCRIYGVDFFEEMGAILGRHPRTLWDCRRFFLAYDEQQLEELLACRVNWSHVRPLIKLESEEERQKLAQRIAREHLTADELDAIVFKFRRSEEEGKRKGKEAKVPANLKAAISKLNSWVQTSQNRVLDLLFGERYNLPSEIVSEPPDELTVEQRDEVEHAIEQLELVAEKAKAGASKLREVLPRFDVVFEERKKREDSKSTEENPLRNRGMRRRVNMVSPVG